MKHRLFSPMTITARIGAILLLIVTPFLVSLVFFVPEILDDFRTVFLLLILFPYLVFILIPEMLKHIAVDESSIELRSLFSSNVFKRDEIERVSIGNDGTGIFGSVIIFVKNKSGESASLSFYKPVRGDDLLYKQEKIALFLSDHNIPVQD